MFYIGAAIIVPSQRTLHDRRVFDIDADLLDEF